VPSNICNVNFLKKSQNVCECTVLINQLLWFYLGLGFMVFNATFNNISVIAWRSVLLVEETGVPGENR
jgi:hypothetical protein